MLNKKATQKRPQREPSFSQFAGGKKPAHEEIARLAYDLYQKRGGRPGRDREDWLRAEEILTLKNRPVWESARG
jgi:hypothetical protein